MYRLGYMQVSGAEEPSSAALSYSKFSTMYWKMTFLDTWVINNQIMAEAINKELEAQQTKSSGNMDEFGE